MPEAGKPSETDTRSQEAIASFEAIEGVFTDVFEAELEDVCWIVEGLLPRGLSIWGAPPKSGKSSISMVMAALVAGFDCRALPPFMSHVPEDGKVIAFSYEATAGELRQILEKGLGVIGNANQAILIADDPWKWRLDDEDSVGQMTAWLTELKPKLVILDPLRNFHSLDEKDSGIISVLSPMRKWAVENDASFLVIHHTSKPGEEGQKKVYNANDLRGTSALFGMADGVVMLTPLGGPEEFGHLRMVATFKRAKGWEREVQLAAWDKLGQQAGEPLKDVDRTVLRLLASGGQQTDAIAQQLRAHGPRAVRDSLERLERNNHINKEGRKWRLTKTG